jgi:preprotein translocase subunit SecE
MRAMAERAGESSGGVLSKPGEWWSRSRDFVVKVREEMRRVTWPTRTEVYATTFVVILTAIFFGLYLWGLDLLFDRVVASILRALGA